MAALMMTVLPGDHDLEWYQLRADSDFLLYLSQQFGSANAISPGPYCTVSDDFQTATCRALMDGVVVVGDGTFNGTEFVDWEDPAVVETTVPDYSTAITDAVVTCQRRDYDDPHPEAQRSSSMDSRAAPARPSSSWRATTSTA
jgi:hypothetical protein